MLAALLLLGSGVSPPAAGAEPQAGAMPFTVVIDAGHGGADPGAISPYGGLREKDVALRAALQTGAALERRGVRVVYTRTTDVLVPLVARAALAQQRGADALLSIHLNAASGPDANGAEAWHGTTDGSAEFAGAVLGALAAPLRDFGVTVRGTRLGPDLAVLRGGVPSALVELGYVTSPRDTAVLSRDAFVSAAAEALATGIAAYRDAPRLAPGPSRAPTLMGMAGLSGMYFVQPGDSLGAIASRLGLTAAVLERLNPVAAVQALLPGQPLQLPDSQAAAAPGDGGGGASAPPSRLPPNAPRQSLPPQPAAGTYTVQPGETLYGIARRTGATVDTLSRLNGLADPERVLAGQTLKLATASGVVPPPAGRRYVVAPGDTLSEVALRLGVTQEALAAANNLATPDRLLAGTSLAVPATR